MRNKIIATVSGLGMAVMPFLAHAQYATTTASDSVNTLNADVGATIGATVPEILALLAALIGLGWGVRKFMKWVSGRKF